MRVALVQDWLTGMRGGEWVLEALCELYPEADIYTLVWVQGSVSEIIESHPIKTSFIQHLPFAKKKYRNYLPLMPSAIERFDLSGYDLVISTSHCVAKGVKVGEGTPHICYCHTPMRYVWEMYEQYFGKDRCGLLTRMAMRLFVNYLRRWDVQSSARVTHFIANSENVKRRIQNHYQRDATVIYPPVDTDFFTPDYRLPITDYRYYLVVSAFAPYKRVDIAIEAFNQLGYPLKITGSGQEEKRLKKMAKSNIEFFGWCGKEKLRELYRGCKVLIFPGEEDFGMVPVEAMACGKPVIAYGKGGALETVAPDGRWQMADGRYQMSDSRGQQSAISNQQSAIKPTGIFFGEQTPESLIEGIKYFEDNISQFEVTTIREQALKFSRQIFKQRIKKFIRRFHIVS